jgi:hypothetical protein
MISTKLSSSNFKVSMFIFHASFVCLVVSSAARQPLWSNLEGNKKHMTKRYKSLLIYCTFPAVVISKTFNKAELSRYFQSTNMSFENEFHHV